MTKPIPLFLLASCLFFSLNSSSQTYDTIVIQEATQAAWQAGTLDSLTTQGDDLTLDTTSSFSYLFTAAGQTGTMGPSQAQINTAYTGTDLDGQVTVSGGIQEWQVPEGGVYSIIAAGAGHNADSFIRGAVIEADLMLNQGDKLWVLVGQEGESTRAGSGGSFVTDTNSTPLIIAGGAGGMRSYVDERNRGTTSTKGQSVVGGSCNAPGGANGQGGAHLGGGNCSSAGGGLLTDGAGCAPGLAFVNGGLGGNASYLGGFGAAGGVNSSSSPGGGGGYSGGAVHYTGGGSSCAGGGGSYLDASAWNVSTSDGNYDSLVTFNGDTIMNINAYNIGDGYVQMDAIKYVSSGVRVSPVHDISSASMDHFSSEVMWSGTEPNGTSITVETRYSTDGGNNWSAFAAVTNGGAIASLTVGTAMDNARLETRVTLATTSIFTTPSLASLTVTVINSDSVVSIAEGASKEQFRVYPNPTTGRFSIVGGAGLVTVLDIMGRNVLTTSDKTIDLSAYQKGIYFVRMDTITRRIVVN